MATGLLSMTTTLAPLTPGITRKSTYKHTGEACPSPKDPAPPVHPRFQVYVNFLWPSEGPRVQPREFCRSVHMCESSGTLLAPVGTGTGTGTGANGRRHVCGGGAERDGWVRVEKVAPCEGASSAGPEHAAARHGGVLHLEDAVREPRISEETDVKKNQRRTARGHLSRVIACGHAFAGLRCSIAQLPSCLSKPSKVRSTGEGGKLACKLSEACA